MRLASGLSSSCWGCCSPLLISGYGANKVVAFTGDTAGTGEFAGSIADPHDRTGKAKTAITKPGTGKWTLSGSNTCTGPIIISLGTLCDDGAPGPDAKPDIAIPTGGSLELNFNGQVIVSKLTRHGLPASTAMMEVTRRVMRIKPSTP